MRKLIIGALEKVMHYLSGTIIYELYYTRYPKVLKRYSDSNYISDADEIKARSGYVFTHRVVIVSWRSYTQIILMKLKVA